MAFKFGDLYHAGDSNGNFSNEPREPSKKNILQAMVNGVKERGNCIDNMKRERNRKVSRGQTGNKKLLRGMKLQLFITVGGIHRSGGRYHFNPSNPIKLQKNIQVICTCDIRCGPVEQLTLLSALGWLGPLDPV
ncbi:hypothetical protein PISMIDRAFT_460989 [Pisolithus microcarpus 441]|uniref:Uncharacterized protein n=1 Tax=Pisolithus microcarpus 441 TaxID=765257 RepID=A0A0C9YF12_9AGAM|nr:hypothetical protein PISMIDRAFT_460989 [Pisolithus microcarpus 441]